MTMQKLVEDLIDELKKLLVESFKTKKAFWMKQGYDEDDIDDVFAKFKSLKKRNILTSAEKDIDRYKNFEVLQTLVTVKSAVITNLEGAPRWVGGDFICSDNNLISLEGAPVSNLRLLEDILNLIETEFASASFQRFSEVEKEYADERVVWAWNPKEGWFTSEPVSKARNHIQLLKPYSESDNHLRELIDRCVRGYWYPTPKVLVAAARWGDDERWHDIHPATFKKIADFLKVKPLEVLQI